jgi:hypothetical protein
MAEWTPIVQTEMSTHYVDFSTIRKAGNKVKIWGMTDFKTMQVIVDLGFLSNKYQVEYDCQNETDTALASLFFSGNMGSGQVVGTSSKRSDPMPVSPRSIGELFWKIACGKQ